MQILNITRKQKIATSAQVAESMLSRMCGLLLSRPLIAGEGLYLVPCNSIHMFGMRFAIDVIFVDRKGIVVGLVKEIKPWMMSKLYWQAYGCLELPVGTIDATTTAIGDQLSFDYDMPKKLRV
jgi:uncharacterized membrane protein (UPF0127 family)